MKKPANSVLIALLFLLGLPPAATLRAETSANWSQWRGVDRRGHSPDSGLLKKWPKGGPKQLWMYNDAGVGYAGYSIVDGKLFTMGAREEKAYLICLNASDGSEQWVLEMDTVLENGWGDGPRATPTVDGDHVYAMSGSGELVCAKHADGSKVWRTNMIKDHGGKMQNWGYTESVLIDGDKVVCTPGGDKGALLALDKKTGKKVWQSEGLKVNAQYSSPIVIGHVGRRQYVQLFQKDLAGFDADTGKVLWKTDYPKGRTAVIPTPIYFEGMVYISAGYDAGCKAIKLGPRNEVEEVYAKPEISNHHGGVILVDGHLYGYHSNRGGWMCQNLKSGDIVWTEKSKLGKGAIAYADGMFYCLGEKKGTVVLIEASPEGWKEAGSFKLDPQSEIRKSRGRIWTHPVVIGGRLFLRDQDLVYCYDVSG